MSQHKPTEQVSYLNSLMVFLNKVMSSAGEKRVMDVVYLCFIKAFDSLVDREIYVSVSSYRYTDKIQTR